MRRNNTQQPTRRTASCIAKPVLTVLALAAAGAAHAQFFTSLNDVFSAPVNAFPVPLGQQTVNLTGSTVFVGNTASGTLVASGGALLTADALSLGNGGTGVGGVTVSGAGTRFTLVGTSISGNNRLEIGNGGTGSLSVVGGAVIDATAACAPGQRC